MNISLLHFADDFLHEILSAEHCRHKPNYLLERDDFDESGQRIVCRRQRGYIDQRRKAGRIDKKGRIDRLNVRADFFLFFRENVLNRLNFLNGLNDSIEKQPRVGFQPQAE